ncbi:unnamed protein product [Effrenium voratum]|uniref:Fatty acid-binding protein n=1 Tax=Effrenium voratum TaxID=2562239 RepID=A0AA36IG24_9DINO|nr:unnamed protein product [Effrenium voratum]
MALCGEWIMDTVEGDMEAVLKDLGVGYMKRTMMYGIGYGVNVMEFHINQEGSKVLITGKTPLGDKEMTLETGGKPFDYMDPTTDELTQATAQWEGEKLRLKTDKEDSLRYVEGGQLVLETTTSSGAKAIRKMRRK